MEVLEFDLSANKKGNLNESKLAQFGSLAKMLLRRMFGFDLAIPVKIKGSPLEVKSFGRALSREKRYMDSYMRYGLNDPKTFKSRASLQGAVSQFERATGLKWPFR